MVARIISICARTPALRDGLKRQPRPDHWPPLASPTRSTAQLSPFIVRRSNPTAQHLTAPAFAMHALTIPSPTLPVAKGDDETHKCPYKTCGKFFSKKYNLKAHLRLHTGEQPFECPRPNCNKKFKWRSSLSSHSVWHTRKEQGVVAAVDVCVGKRPSPTTADPVPAPKRKRPRANKARDAPKPHKPTAPVPAAIIGVPHVIDSIAAALSAAVDADPLPGSPVTSDVSSGGGQQKSLDCELFSGTLPPLSTVSEGVAAKIGDELLLHEGDVDAAILADATSVLFANAHQSPPPVQQHSAGALQGLDTRFGPFELDNLQSYYMNKVDGM